MKNFYETKVAELESMADMTRLDLNKNQRKTLGAVITIFVHARDVVEIMIAEQISKVSEFGWTKQLRYVWDATDGVQVHQHSHSVHVSCKDSHVTVHVLCMDGLSLR